ncbi:hypothetical protein RhiirA4_473771 [Rhizophagus irregularis]|uniref:RRM domain-containing protein n=1 Tax=Rhizophagus irregularis TaxID=588596 RepID=A0A2I1H7B6_9GLOM|nr:hypothetical protein RhiirA4_473771 [Rhizophagus irregularis]
MNIDTTSSSAPALNLIPSAPSGLPVNKVQVVTTPQTTTTLIETVDASIHAPFGAKGKDKAVEFSNPARAPSPDASKVSVQSSSFRYHAAAYLRDAPDAFKTKFTTNHAMCDEVDRAFSKFSSYGSRARCEGSGDDKRILVSFFVQADLTSCTFQPCADLLDLTFVQYSPADMKRNVEAKSLFVTDIPLFLTETQRDARRHYVAVLVGIPKNIKEADLTDIANQVSAKAINIPLSFTSYKPKPYVYMNFFSQETLDAALELTVAHLLNAPHVPIRKPLHNLTSSTPASKRVYNKAEIRIVIIALPHVPALVLVPRDPINPIGRPVITSTSQPPPLTIRPEEVAALRQQILDLSATIRNLDDRVEWFSAQLESHEYCIAELELTVFPQDNPNTTYESYDTYQDNADLRQESQVFDNWDEADLAPTTCKLPPSRSARSLPIINSFAPRRTQNSSQPIDFNKELYDITSTQQLIHGQLGSILTKLDGISPPPSDNVSTTPDTNPSNPDGQRSGGWN